MAKASSWIEAFRLRTLPLALSTVAMGGFLAWQHEPFSLRVWLLAFLTTLFLQILSNLANDYGDSMKGLDNHERTGPKRTVQKGLIAPAAMKKAVYLFAFLSLVSGLLLLSAGTRGWQMNSILWLFLLGVCAIAAAVFYTVGSKPYGYRGLGDLFVFFFFGWVGVAGTYLLITHKLNYSILLPASTMGLLSTAVLNLNNMRDIENDGKNNKNTWVVKMGFSAAKYYHAALILTGLALLIVYAFDSQQHMLQWIFLFSYPLFIVDLLRILSTQKPSLLDSYLKKLALSTLLLTLLFGLGQIIS